MAAPASIQHTHVHSLRVAAGHEALAARVLLKDGTAGFGFTLNEDAGLARDMAAWDALCRSKGVPLYVLLGGSHRKKLKIEKDENPVLKADWSGLRKGILDNAYDLLRIDPFAWSSLEQVVTIAAAANAFDLGVALLAPNAHPWEIQYCAALAATFRGDDTRVIVRSPLSFTSIEVSQSPGVGVEFSSEAEFKKIQWQS